MESLLLLKVYLLSISYRKHQKQKCTMNSRRRPISLELYKVLNYLVIGQPLLDSGNRLSWVQMLRADLGTVHDRVATIQLESVIQLRQTLLRLAITTIFNPAIRLHQDSRSQVLVGIPPIARARSTAASTENAFVHSIQLGAVFLGLQVLTLAGLLGQSGLQPGFNATVLFVKVPHVRYQIFNDIHVWKRVYFAGLAGILLINVGQASQCVLTVNVHGTRAANALTTGATKGESRVLLVFDFEQGVEDHGSTVIEIDRVGGEVRLLALFGVPSVHFEVLDALVLGVNRDFQVCRKGTSSYCASNGLARRRKET
jgi:hypothetical protein